MTPADDLRLYTVREAADVMGLTVDMVRRYIKDGRLPVRRIGNRNIRITRTDMAVLIDTLGGASGSRWNTSPAADERAS